MDTMQFNVAGLLQEPVGTMRQFEVSERVEPLDEQLVASEPVNGHVKLTRTNDGILVDAKLHTEVQQVCSRCLAEFTVPLKLHFDEEFQPTVDVATGLPLPEPDDRATFTIDAKHILDLDEAFRQYALLALPMAPLCKASCAGLCPHCGHNLNEGRCKCPSSAVDSRWQVLADYLEQRSGTSDSVEGSAKADHKKKKRK